MSRAYNRVFNNRSHLLESTDGRRALTEPESSPATLHRVAHWIGSLSIMAACIAGYFVIGERERPDRRKPPRSTVADVISEPLQLHVGQVRLDANGVVVPLREIQLATEVAGRIIRQSEDLRPGKSLTQGDVLIELDPTEYELEVRRLRAQASQESAQQNSIDVSIANTKDLLELANQQVDLAKSEQARVESLIKRGAASATESDASRRPDRRCRRRSVG